MTKQLLLPRTDSEGRSYISYSQIKGWNSAKGFSTGKLGKYEYLRGYLFGEDWPSQGWAEFGLEVEDYICERKGPENFTHEERKTLETIKPLGVLQHEAKLEFGDFYLKGFLDDATEDFRHIRDYKTASLNSSKQYYQDDYRQLDIYAEYVNQRFGYYPDKMEVVMIERTGNAFRGGRKVLKVGENVWYHDRETNPERQAYLMNYIRTTAEEISRAYRAFLTLSGQDVPQRKKIMQHNL